MKEEKKNDKHSGNRDVVQQNDSHPGHVETTQLHYYTSLVENLRDAVIFTDEAFLVTTWNKAAEHIYGWTEAEAMGMKVTDLLATDFGKLTAAEIFKQISEGGYFRGEITDQSKMGKHILIRTNITPVFDSAKQLNGTIIINRDITQRKKLEDNITYLNEHLNEQVQVKTQEVTNIFERITDGFIALDKDWRYTYANKKVGELLQRDPASLIGKNVWEEFPDAVGSETYKTFFRAMELQQYISSIDYYEPLDLWQENDIYPSPQGLSIFIRNISEKKRAEEKIIKTSRLYFFISQINQMIVRVTGRDYLFSEACNIAVGIGQFRMAWIGMIDESTKSILPVMLTGEAKELMPLLKTISLDDRHTIDNPVGKALMEGSYIICNDLPDMPVMNPWEEIQLNAGYRSAMILPLKMFGKVVGLFAFYATTKSFFDAQEIALLEEATGDVSFALENIEKEILRKADEVKITLAYKENEITLNRITDGVLSVDNEWHYTFLNDAALATHPLGKEATVGKIIWDVHPEMRETPFWDKCHEAMEKKVIVEFENYYASMDSWFDVKVYPSPEGLTVFYKDITEEKKRAEEIRNSEEKIRLIMTAALDAIVCMNTKGLITFWNPQAENIFGWKRDEVLGRRLSDVIIPEPFREMHEKGIETYLETGKGPVLNVLLELTAIDRNNKELPVELTVLPIKQANDEFFCAFIRDISRQKEEEMRISKATISAQENERYHIGLELHDNVNQILVGSLLHLAMIKNATKEKAAEFVDMSKGHIMNAIDEIRKLSHQLAPASFDDISLRLAFESLLQSINTPEGKFTITTSFDEFEKELISTDIQINLYRILQEQVNNIVKYAKATVIEVDLKIQGGLARMRIFDNGIGFDTRQVRKGIGLGNMKKRTELFEGKFTLRSSAGKGTEIIVEIPLNKPS